MVAAGDTLATLDTASLQDSIDQAQADLVTAQQQMTDDLASQTSSSSSGSTSPSTPSAPSTPSGPSSPSSLPATAPTPAPSPSGGGTPPGGSATDPAVTQAIADVHAAQQALLDQYQVAADALTTSGASVTASQASCAQPSWPPSPRTRRCRRHDGTG